MRVNGSNMVRQHRLHLRTCWAAGNGCLVPYLLAGLHAGLTENICILCAGCKLCSHHRKPAQHLLLLLLRRRRPILLSLPSLLQGAAATRNALLDEACGADYVIFFDDDVMPQPGCLDAYVSAFKAFPGERAFAGERAKL